MTIRQGLRDRGIFDIEGRLRDPQSMALLFDEMLDVMDDEVAKANSQIGDTFSELATGGFLLDPNEFNGWAARGVAEDVNTVDLGSVGGTISRLAGGIMYPYDVQLLGFECEHYNSNLNAEAWGWRIAAIEKKATPAVGSNTQIATEWLRETIGTGATATAPRDYQNVTSQTTIIDFEPQNLILPAGHTLTLGVEAPTAVATNYYVYVKSGHMHFKRLS